MFAINTLRVCLCIAALFSRLALAGAAPAVAPAVSGIVSDPEGRPVSGARVSAVIDESGVGTVAGIGTSDAHGRFHLEVKVPGPGARYPRLELVVEAPGFALTLGNVPRQETKPVEIVLQLESEVQVELVDQAGAPVPGVRVRPDRLLGRAMSDPILQFPPALADRLAQTTDAHGACVFRGLPRDARLRLAIVDERFARPSLREEVSLGDGAATNPQRITLLPAATVQGTIVFQPAGRPAAGIRVGAQGVSGLGVNGLGVWADAVTNERGEYQMKQMRPGIYNIALDLQGALAKEWTAQAHEEVTVAQGEHLTAKDFALLAGAVITGRVVAADDGQPLPGMAIGVYGPAHPRSSAWVQRAETVGDGTYFHRVPPGAQYVYIQSLIPPGFAKPEDAAREVTVHDGETLTLDFKLPRATAKP
jgi:hypothetical protein